MSSRGEWHGDARGVSMCPMGTTEGFGVGQLAATAAASEFMRQPGEATTAHITPELARKRVPFSIAP